MRPPKGCHQPHGPVFHSPPPAPGMGDSYPRAPAGTPDMDPWDTWAPCHDEPLDSPRPYSPLVGNITFGPLHRIPLPYTASAPVTAAAPVRCNWCGDFHAGVFCPKVQEIEYHENGTVKRVVMR